MTSVAFATIACATVPRFRAYWYRDPVARRHATAVRDRYLVENHDRATIGRRIAEFCRQGADS